MKTIHQLACCITACSALAMADETIPGAPQTKPIAVVGATIHTISGPAIEDGTILFEDGRITDVGASTAADSTCTPVCSNPIRRWG